jgi:hypothetical protein
MHPSFQARIDDLGSLLQKTRAARQNAARMIGRGEPFAPRPIRYQVKSKAKGAFHIIEVETGKCRGFRFSFKSALDWAMQLEAKANRASAAQ